VGASLLCCLLIAFTTDVRLLLNTSALPFMRLGNVLPMTGLYLVVRWFFWRFPCDFISAAEVVGSMAALPAVSRMGKRWRRMARVPDGLVRRHFRWQGESRSAMIAFETVLSTVSGVLDCSATLFLYWLRYLPRQDFRGTLLHVFLMTLSVATATSLPFVV